jgi:hypothetical protein
MLKFRILGKLKIYKWEILDILANGSSTDACRAAHNPVTRPPGYLDAGLLVEILDLLVPRSPFEICRPLRSELKFAVGPPALQHEVGSIIACTDTSNLQARNAFCAIRPPGHHAGPLGTVTSANDPHGSQGFCFLNNIAIAGAYAVNTYRRQGEGLLDSPPTR